MKKNGFAPLIIILLIVTLGLVGYFVYRNYSTKSPFAISPSSLSTADQANLNTETVSSPSPVGQSTSQVYIKDNLIFTQNYHHVGDIWVKDTKTDQEKQITSYGYNSHPKLSPNGKWIAYLSWPKEKVSEQTKAVKEGGIGGSLTNNVWIIQNDGTNAKQVIKNISSESEVSWSPDSRYFVTLTQGYQIFDVQLMKVVAIINDNDPGMENAQATVWLDGHRFVYQKTKEGSLDSAPAIYNIETKTAVWQ